MSIESLWYGQQPLAWLLWPLSLVYRAVVAMRRLAYRTGLKSSTRFDKPVVVIGNLTVGGTGKTPLVIWLVERLRDAGFKPGIVTRGYRGKSRSWPRRVAADSDPVEVGDEAVLMARRCDCPVYAAPDRVVAAGQLLAETDVDVILADDGLQHYALARDIEVAVIDDARGFGNGFMLPAGPLRESGCRLEDVDVVVHHGGEGVHPHWMRLDITQALSLDGSTQVKSLSEFVGQSVHAIAGIGNPARFFDRLRELGLDVVEHAFPDHHDYIEQDFLFADGAALLMTEKDAVKVAALRLTNSWMVRADTVASDSIVEQVIDGIRRTNKV